MKNYHNIALISLYNEKYFRQNLRRKQKTRFIRSKIFSENRTFYEITWRKTECIVTFQLQKLLSERATIFGYTYIS